MFVYSGRLMATRNPRFPLRNDGGSLIRRAERMSWDSLPQDPPRKTRIEQSPLNHAEPSVGALA